MKAAKRITCFLTVAAMIFTSIPAAAFEKPANATAVLQNGYSDNENAYAIYPIPQSISYGNGGSFTLDSSVQVVCEDGIDEYTDQFLNEILADYEKTRTNSATVAQSGSQILIGINGSGGAVDTWAKDNLSITDKDLFTKTDAYLLSAKDGTIAILGKDTDTAFYGLATLQMMFSSFNGSKFLNAQIEDYAGMQMRGFIEGMYGGWSYEGRESLMRFGRDVKMNCYIYASKTDDYHTSKWDVLYPDEEISQLAHLAQVGEETKVTFGWSVHAANFFKSLPATSDASYNEKFNENYDKLIAKFQQLYDAGVRKFAILNDDFGGGSHTEVVRLLNKVDDEFLIPKGCKNLTYCMQGYNKGWSNESELAAMQDLNDSIDLFWTGDDVNSPITQETIDFVKEKTGHEAVFWLNYPVNEHGSAGIYLGEISHYVRNDVTGLAGAMSNPSVFTEANKVGLFQLAAAFWNNHNYLDQAVSIWENAFKYLQPEVYESYLTLARNIANCPGSGRVPAGFPESEYIKDELEAVSEKIQNGDPIADDTNTQTLIDEFSNMLEAIETFRAECSNEELINDLNCWLNSLNDVATAGKAILEAVVAIEYGDLDTAWANIGTAGAAMDTWNTYTPKRGNNAQAGSKRLVPFIQKVLPIAKNQILPLINPSITFPVSHIGVIGGVDQTDSSELAKAFDGDENTLARFNTNQKAGDYFGIDLGKTTTLQTIKIIHGQANDDGTPNANGINFFHNAVLEYSMTGKDNDWHTIQEYADDNAPATITVNCSNDNLAARYVRLRLTKTGTTGQNGTPNKEAYYTHIWEFSVNDGQTEDSEEPAYGLYASEGIQANVALNQLTYSIAANTSVTLPSNGYIGIKLMDLSKVQNVSYQLTDNSDSLTLQYSTNSIQWKTLTTDTGGATNAEARYVRLYNGTNSSISTTLSSFSVKAAVSPANLRVSDRSPELNTMHNNTTVDMMFDGDLDTGAFFESKQIQGHYLTIDFGATIPVYNFDITQKHNDNDVPKFYDAEIYLSTDGSNWGEPLISIANSQSAYLLKNTDPGYNSNYYVFRRNDLEGMTARYMKILITSTPSNEPRLRISEIKVNKDIETSDTAINKIETNLEGNVDAMIDGDISTAYVSDTPSDGTAYIKYPLTENTKLTSVTFMQNANNITNATVEAEVWDGNNVTTEKIGILDAGSKIFYFDGEKDILSLKVTWPADTTPTLFEIMPNTGEKMHSISFSGDGAPTESLVCAENRFLLLPNSTTSKDGQTFKGWSDGTKTYPAGTNYTMGTSDVTLSAVWETSVPVTSITVTPKTSNLVIGKSVTLDAEVLPSNADSKDVTYTSNHPEIAAVDKKTGKVTALKTGNATITAACGGQSDECTITVSEVKATSVTITPKAAKLSVNEKTTLNASILPLNTAKKDVTWTSGNTNVATVNTETGEVTAVAEGIAIITATAKDGSEKSGRCIITVSDSRVVKVSSVTVTPSKAELNIGSTQTLEASVLPANASNPNLKWTSDHDDIVSVEPDTGKVTALKAGKAIITATATDGSNQAGRCTITVKSEGEESVKVTSVSVMPKTVSLKAGETQTLTLTIKPDNATDNTVTWSSDHTEFVTVNQNTGKVTAVAEGTAIITATANDGSGESDTCTVTVVPTEEETVPVKSITITPDPAEVELGSSLKLAASVLPTNATNKDVTWSSENPKIATVDESNGTITPIAEGTASITATAADGSGVSKTISLTVKPKGEGPVKVTSISVLPKTVTLAEGETQDLTFTVKPDNAAVKTVTWSSVPESVATVSADGTITAIAEGTAVITATADDGSAKYDTCTVTVLPEGEKPVKTTSITITPDKVSLYEGGTKQLTKTIAPENTTNKNVTWSSNNESIATVTEDGLVKAIAKGTAIITAAAEDGSGVKGTCTVTVTEKPAQTTIKVSSITITPTKLNLKKGATGQIRATVLPAKATNKAVRWTTSKPSVASVSQSGFVRAISAGTTIITVSALDGSGIKKTCTVTVTDDSANQPKIEKGGTYEDKDGNYLYTVTDLSGKTVMFSKPKNEKLTKITIPDTVTLGDNTYTVTSIEKNAFKNNKKITAVTIGKNIESIGNSAFEGCTKIKNVNIKSTCLKAIGSKAFNKCKLLKTIKISSKKLKTVGKNAFKGIHKKATIKVPSSKLKKYKKLLAKKGQSKSVKIKK